MQDFQEGGVEPIGVARGKGPWPTQIFSISYMDILCFERRYSKQNSVTCLKSSILSPKKILGWLRLLGFQGTCRGTVKFF